MKFLFSTTRASGMGAWFPVGCGRHRIEPSIRNRAYFARSLAPGSTSEPGGRWVRGIAPLTFCLCRTILHVKKNAE